jgi:hypothetical protein
MKKLLIVAALACAPAFAVEMRDGKVMLTEREQMVLQQCEQLGGCAVISRMELMRVMAEVRAQWEAEVAERFGAAVKEQAEQVCKKTI